MIDPELAEQLTTVFAYGVGASLAGVAVWFFNRKKENCPRLDQSAAVGFLVGAAWGAIVSVFQAMI